MLTRNNLSTILKEEGLSVKQLATNLNLSYDDLYEIYMGRKDFTPEILSAVAEFLNIEEIDLLSKGRVNIYQNIGLRLRKIREEKNLTLIELGKMSNVSYTHISEIERGKTCASLKTLEKLAKVLETPTSVFFQFEENLSLGDKIRRLREKQNLTQIQLAEKIGVSLSLIGQIETERVKPALNTLYNIANVFGVSISYFLLNDETEKILAKQGNNEIFKSSQDELHKISQGLSSEDVDLLIDLVKALKNHNRVGIQEENLDPQTRELVQIMKQLSEEDKTFVIENAKWLLKKSKGT